MEGNIVNNSGGGGVDYCGDHITAVKGNNSINIAHNDIVNSQLQQPVIIT